MIFFVIFVIFVAILFSSFMTPIDIPLPTPPLAEIFWEQHRQKIIIGALAFIIIFLFIIGLFFWQHSQREAARALFMKATNMAGWQKVVDTYPRSRAAANALLLIAGAQRNQHHLDQSNATYARFLEKFSQTPLAVSALLGRAMNADDEAKSQVAIKEFQQAASAYSKSYGAPFALMSEARILGREGKPEELKRILTLISSQYPDSLVVTMMRRDSVK